MVWPISIGASMPATAWRPSFELDAALRGKVTSQCDLYLRVGKFSSSIILEFCAASVFPYGVNYKNIHIMYFVVDSRPVGNPNRGHSVGEPKPSGLKLSRPP